MLTPLDSFEVNGERGFLPIFLCLLAESPKTFLLLDGPKTLDVENRSVS